MALLKNQSQTILPGLNDQITPVKIGVGLKINILLGTIIVENCLSISILHTDTEK